ncbi:MAG: RNA pseudouridine synthase [Candidatus Liptonbacteria bacterium]|nr:RNA pseudouridine synthase [Candidatus Liptonbacteria bacterium]
MSEPEAIYEDKNFLAVAKPAGLLVHQTSIKYQVSGIRKREPTLVDWLTKRYPEIRTVGDDTETRPGIVHRLDKETSGILLVAKTQACFAYLKSLFANRRIKKTYLAWVCGVPKETRGAVRAAISLKSGTTRRTVHKGKLGKPAVTEYRVKKEMRDEKGKMFALLEVMPLTGRTHQIRVHLASIGHPVVGDKIYGNRECRMGNKETRLMLHALSLEFTSLDGKRLRLDVEPPEDFVAPNGEAE